MYYCSIKDIPKYEDLEMFSSFRIKTTDEIVLELRTHNIQSIPEAICVYKHTEDNTELLFSGRLNRNCYNGAMRILKEHYFYYRLWKNTEELETKNKEEIKVVTSSLDKNQLIYISEKGREELFNYILLQEKSDTLQRVWKDIDGLYEYMFSAENLERYCLGATNRADYAYKKISKLLRKEYEEWKADKCAVTGFKDKNGKDLHVGDRVRYYTYPDYDKYYNAIIEKFASTTVRVLIHGKVPRYTQSRYLELITDDSIELLAISRGDLKELLKLINENNVNGRLNSIAYKINKIIDLGEMKWKDCKDTK